MRTPSFRVSNANVAIGLETMLSRTARTSAPCSSRTSSPAWKRSWPASPRASPNVPATSCGPSSGATGQRSGVRAKASASNAGGIRGGGGEGKATSDHGHDQPTAGRTPRRGVPTTSIGVGVTIRTIALPASATRTLGEDSATADGRRNRASLATPSAKPGAPPAINRASPCAGSSATVPRSSTTYRSPLAAAARAIGRSSPTMGDAIVVTIPSRPTTRMSPLPVSATSTRPVASTVTPHGVSNRASGPGPSA